MKKQLTLFEAKSTQNQPKEILLQTKEKDLSLMNIKNSRLIRIGLNQLDKQTLLNEYVSQYPIKKIYIFYWPKFKQEYELSIPVEYIEYKNIIMYVYFYRLLEEIDDSCLIIMDECMRTQNRSDLTYNCAHHYLNQTSHKIVFEYFPIIDHTEDFMILLDFLEKGKYKGKGFDWGWLQEEDIQIKPIQIDLKVIPIELTQKQKEQYQKKKEELFNSLGQKDPDTIPRNLHVFVGSFKKSVLDKDRFYIARNARFNLPNVKTYDQWDVLVVNPIILDFPHRRLDLNDYLKENKHLQIEFLSSGLPVDNYYSNECDQWLKRVNEFYAYAAIHQ